MSEDTFRIMIVSSVMIIAFAWLLISVTINVVTVDNNQSIAELSGGALNLTGYANTLNNAYVIANNSKSTFNDFDPFSIIGIVVSGIFKIAIAMYDMIFAPFKLISQVAVQIFQVPVIIVNVIFTIITITIIFGIWSIIKVGN